MIPFSMIRKRPVWSSCLVYGFLMSQLFTTSYYLPIYFQGVKGVSPTLSGVYLLPSILSRLFLAIGSGILGKYIYPPGIVGIADDWTVGKLGYYLPFSLFSAVLLAISNRFLSTLSPGASTGNWIGYQILLGAGCVRQGEGPNRV